MGKYRFSLIHWLALLLVCLGLAACDGSSSSQGSVTDPITPWMLVTPNALVGSGPSEFNWSPVGARLAYVDAGNGHTMLWLYDPALSTSKPVWGDRNEAISETGSYTMLVLWAVIVPERTGVT